MRDADVRRRDGRFRRRMSRAIWIEPGVELESAVVRFSYGESKRIPIWIGRLSHLAGEILGPRLQLRIVERIRRWTNLENYGVEVECGRAVEYCDQLVLL